ncbi:MAG: 4Fe-4S binding protein [Thermoanaerobaculaceae bacterium]|jgi:ferredoxin|nr:4Fe-4S binding protein [Thermoanaerobaculaceae bacterium]
MNDVYARLASKLDNLPNGFPPAPSGVEQRILRKLFTPEDAAWALQLKAFPETAGAVARRLGRPLHEVQARLDDLAGRGLIAAMRLEGALCYAVVPFVIGIYEFQLGRLDRELAEMVEEYLPTLMKAVGDPRPALARVIPVGTRIEARTHVLPHDDLRAAIDRAQVFRLGHCICREEKALLGQPCRHPVETCLTLASDPDAYRDVPQWGRPVSREEAHAVLDLAEREGLVHCTYNAKGDPMFVCNCCRCCCGLLRGISEFAAPHVLVRSNYLAQVDLEACTGCGVCSGGRCPMAAIASDDGVPRVDPARCIGCGACAVTCPSDAIRLVPRPVAERLDPPKTIVHWFVARASQRHGKARGLALAAWVGWQATRMKLDRWRSAH